jgi:small-conductance mechanosensitive channel
MPNPRDLVPAPLIPLLEVELFGNYAWRFVLAAVVLALALIGLRLLRRVALERIERFARRTTTDVDDLLAQLVDRTHTVFLLVVALFLASRPLDLAPGVEIGVRRIFAIVLFLQVGAWAARVVDWLIERQLRRREEDPAAPRAAILSLFGFLGQVAVWSVVALLALDNFGVDVTGLVAGLGIGGIAIGLALQNVLQDTFASLSIILDKPFETGDFLVLSDFMGTVEKIGIKSTRLRSLSGEQIVIGNDDLLSSRIRNYKRMTERRAAFGFGVLYDTPPEKLERIPGIVREIVESLDQTRFDRAHFKAFADSSLDFEVVYYVLVPDYNVLMDIQQEINLRLLRALAAEGVGFAFPTRTVYLAGGDDKASDAG